MTPSVDNLSKGCHIARFEVSQYNKSMNVRLLDNNKRKKIYSSKRKGTDFIVTEMFKDERIKPKRYVCRGRGDYYKLMKQLVGNSSHVCDKDIEYCMRHKGLAYLEYQGRFFELRDVGYAEFYYMANNSPSISGINKVGINKLNAKEYDDPRTAVYLYFNRSEHPLVYAFIKEKLYDKFPSPDNIGRRYRTYLLNKLEEFIKETYAQYIEEGIFGEEMKNRDKVSITDTEGEKECVKQS